MAYSQPAVIEPGRSHSLWAMIICLVIGALGATLPFVENAVLYGLVLVIGICVIVPAWYARSRGRLDYFEPVHVVSFLYFVFFGLGAIWTVNQPDSVAYDQFIVPYIPQAAFYCLLGQLAMLAGYYGPWHRGHETRSLDERPNGALFLLLAGAPGLAGFIALAAMTNAMLRGQNWTTGVSSLVQLSPLFIFAWALAWLLYFSGRSTRAQRWVLFGLLLPGGVLVASLTFSNKSVVTMLIGVPLVARWYVKRRVPWLSLLVLVLILVFVFFPLYNTYRWSDPMRSQAQRLSMTMDTMRGWNSDAYMRFSVGTFKTRMAMINSVAILVRDVGRWVPFAKGETIFMPTVQLLIPRFVWPDKPLMEVGKDFGRQFRITNYMTRETHIGATIPGELYWNFGLPGVVFGMGLLGAVMSLLYRRYGASDERGPVPRAISIMLLVQFSHLIEGVVAPATSEMVRTLMLIGVMRWFGRHYGLLTRADP